MTIMEHVRLNECRDHQTRRNSHPISAEVVLPQLQSEIKVAQFLFASHSFLANNLRFMVKLIDKTIVINGKIHKNKRERVFSSKVRLKNISVCPNPTHHSEVWVGR